MDVDEAWEYIDGPFAAKIKEARAARDTCSSRIRYKLYSTFAYTIFAAQDIESPYARLNLILGVLNANEKEGMKPSAGVRSIRFPAKECHFQKGDQMIENLGENGDLMGQMGINLQLVDVISPCSEG
jgi:hypothetical protein